MSIRCSIFPALLFGFYCERWQRLTDGMSAVTLQLWCLCFIVWVDLYPPAPDMLFDRLK